MAGTKISALTAGAALGGTEALPAVQTAATVKITAAQIKTFTSASPTLVTPVLGVATGTSLALAAGAVGTPSLNFGTTNTGFWAVAGGNISVSAGGVERFRFGSGGDFGVTGGLNLGGTVSAPSTYLSAPATATFQHGAADAASPVAQTIKFQDVVAGTSNTAGVNATIQAPAGTGTGAGGSFIFQVAAAGISGTAKNAQATALTIASDKSVTGAASVVAGTFLKSGSYTVATVPSASAAGAGARIYVSDEVGGATPAFSDATNWRRYADRAIIS